MWSQVSTLKHFIIGQGNRLVLNRQMVFTLINDAKNVDTICINKVQWFILVYQMFTLQTKQTIQMGNIKNMIYDM